MDHATGTKEIEGIEDPQIAEVLKRRALLTGGRAIGILDKRKKP